MQYNPFGDLRSIGASEKRIFNDSNGSLIAVSYEARSSLLPLGFVVVQIAPCLLAVLLYAWTDHRDWFFFLFCFESVSHR